jgi:anion-transporting  ArsA/GET3 family ATPase
MKFESLLNDGRLIVCCGSGGVGKTTAAAALALQGALAGRKTVVVTIDPAKRLANSLGLETLGDAPQRIDLRALDPDLAERAEDGEVWAMMLDVKRAFDDLIRRLAPDEAAGKRILDNRLYHLMSTTLHGVLEYVAVEKLFELYTGGYYDLIILDTPPTKNALDFLEAPQRLARFFDRRVVKWFLPGEKKGLIGRFFQPGLVVVGLVSRILGERFTKDLMEFFDSVSAIIEPFQERGEMVEFILRDPQTAFVIVTSADPRRIEEAIYFHEKLATLNQKAAAFVVNRVCTGYDTAHMETADNMTPEQFQQLVEQMAPVTDEEGVRRLLEQLGDYYRRLITLANRDHRGIKILSDRVGRRILRLVPLLREDVHDIHQLLKIGDYLVGRPSAA